MSSQALKVRDLSKTYQNGKEQTRVLKGLDLDVQRGELVAVVGPSGAGKTTLLYMLGGLARPSAGHVEIGGVSFSGLRDAALSKIRNQRLGFVFQSHHLLPELTALENVALPLRVGGKGEGQASQAARQLLQEVGLAGRVKHKPGELSGGEQQRVAIARALVTNPDLVLADEPTGNLDRANSLAVFELLKDSTRHRGQAVVMVTHNDELAGLADRIVRMRDGKNTFLRQALLVNLNGKLVDKEKAVVSVFDHGLLYGDGVFEGIRAYHGRVFRLKAHLNRLFDSAKAILLKIPASPAELEKQVLRTLAANKLSSGYVRLVVTRGAGDLGLSPDNCPKATYFIIADKIKLYPEKYYREGLDLVTVPTRRNVNEALSPRIKSLNYLNNIMAKIEASQRGALEAVMLTQEGYVAECTGDNLFILRRGKLLTPPCYLGALEGVTRDVVMELAKKLRIDCVEEPFTRYDIYTSQEAFLTGTAAEVVPVVTMDGRPLGTGEPGPVTKKLIAAFRKLTLKDGPKIPSGGKHV